MPSLANTARAASRTRGGCAALGVAGAARVLDALSHLTTGTSFRILKRNHCSDYSRTRPTSSISDPRSRMSTETLRKASNPWLVLALVCLAQFMVVLDSTS